MEKTDVSNGIVKNYFSCQTSCQLYIHIRLFLKKKNKNQIKICSREIGFISIVANGSKIKIPKSFSLSLSLSLSHQYHLHNCRYTNFSKVKCWLIVCLIFSYRLASGAWAINECKAPCETTVGSS